MAANQWLFTQAEVDSSPSIAEGMPLAEERLRRAKGVNFIYNVGIMLNLPQLTLYVAGVFFHRFYMRCSMDEKRGIHHYVSLHFSHHSSFSILRLHRRWPLVCGVVVSRLSYNYEYTRQTD